MLYASFCLEALEEAIAKYGKPEIMNTDQGSQHTGVDWITTLTKAKIKISMDGRGRYLDNIFLERLWRSLKQEVGYLYEITNGFQAKQFIDDWIGFTTLSGLTPPSTHARQTQYTSPATPTLSTWPENLGRFRTKVGLNKHLGRYKSRTCPNRYLILIVTKCYRDI